ncbi:RNA polymerase sigma factor [Paenibacillus allorhizosphaerae]|uniref:RNA polymerase sigma factor n=1 Tax=Paenibacillus allorhizosphaerae TaxID=2849866 RepID=A0ABM8VLV7_9BACL|nr:sigma-70 family RNA polymerase sigma factor [Paenibacillus allorhizosphaerae]CAG7648991.1 RNA polymerase sigma-H factor [Paenibacillus allorhizosphaerae]
MNDPVSDEQLVAEALGGNREAFAELVHRYKNKVYGLLRGMGADGMDAQDLAQETFLKAYRGLAGHDPSKSFASWLYTIAANGLRDHWKRKRPPDDAAVAAEASAGESPEEIYLQAERRSELRERLKRLPENYRMVLLLRYTNDLSYEEISGIMAVPIAKVQNDLHRAKKRLKQVMTEEEGGATHEMLKQR